MDFKKFKSKDISIFLNDNNIYRYGALIPKGQWGNWMVFLSSYASNIFWTLFTGVIFAKLSRPSRLKRQLKFSNIACVNNNTKVFTPYFPDDDKNDETIIDGRWSEYGKYQINKKYKTLIFRYGDMRPRARICDSNFTLLYFERSTRNIDGYEDYNFTELDFDINDQIGRVRSMSSILSHSISIYPINKYQHKYIGMDMSTPLLSLPYTVKHVINELSPLYHIINNKELMKQRKVEIIAVVDGIDEATSDNFQCWWSYTIDDIVYDYNFKPMVKSVFHSRSQKQILNIDFDRIDDIQKIQT